MLKIKDWEKFQHYKTKNGERPVWLKLYRTLLDDFEFHSMPVEARAILPLLWLIASEKDGNLPDAKKIAFRLRLSEQEVKNSCKILVTNGFIENIESFYTDPIPEDIEKKERGYREEKEVAVYARESFRKIFDFGCDLFPALATRRSEIISQWIDSGADVEMDIISEIERSKGKEIKSWAYFTQAIMDAKATRERPLPEGQPRQQSQPQKKSHALKALEASARVAMKLEREGYK